MKKARARKDMPLRISLDGITKDNRLIVVIWEQGETSRLGKRPDATDVKLHLVEPGTLPNTMLTQLLSYNPLSETRYLTENEVIYLLEQGEHFSFNDIGTLAGFEVAEKLLPAHPGIFSEKIGTGYE